MKSGLEVVPAAVHYEDVAKSQTAQVLGSSGAIGDFLQRLIIVPETTAAGTVALLDLTTSRNVFIAGTLADLTPITIELGIRSTLGPWKVTTGDNVHVIAVGHFT